METCTCTRAAGAHVAFAAVNGSARSDATCTSLPREVTIVADETVATWSDFLREMRGPLVWALQWKTVLLSELKRDKNQRRWQGKQITIPVINAPQQGAQMINAETSTMGVPVVLDHQQANIKTATIAIAVSFSTQVMEQARDLADTSWAETVPTKMQAAEDVIAR